MSRAARPAFPVPVFAAAGADAWGEVQELRARPEVRLVSSPRHASVLLVAGAVPGEQATALDRIHDQVPHPRCTVARRRGGGSQPGAGTVVNGTADELVAAVVEAHEALRKGRWPSETDRLPDVDPAEWRGAGPYGQGGEGMMGGTPYGRPMAMTGDARDGLYLDRLHLRLGPFLDALPPGLVLDVTLQGDVLQRVDIASLPAGASVPEVPAVRRDLRWLAHGLHVQGLDAHGARAAGLAAAWDVPGVRRRFGALWVSVRRSGLLRGLRGVGRVRGHGDAASRWAARLRGIDAALAGDPPDPGGPVPLPEDLADALVGGTLAGAVTTLLSFGPCCTSGGPATRNAAGTSG